MKKSFLIAVLTNVFVGFSYSQNVKLDTLYYDKVGTKVFPQSCGLRPRISHGLVKGDLTPLSAERLKLLCKATACQDMHSPDLPSVWSRCNSSVTCVIFP